MRSALASVEGVDEDDISIDFATKTVKVNCEGGCTPEALTSAVVEKGFGAKVAE